QNYVGNSFDFVIPSIDTFRRAHRAPNKTLRRNRKEKSSRRSITSNSGSRKHACCGRSLFSLLPVAAEGKLKGLLYRFNQHSALRQPSATGCYFAATPTPSGACSVTLRGLVFTIMPRALSTSAAAPSTISKNWSVLSAVSYCMMLSFEIPMPKSPAPIALKPPITAAFSNAATIHATTGPATSTGPIPGMAKKADPDSNPQKPPQNAPVLPQYF